MLQLVMACSNSFLSVQLQISNREGMRERVKDRERETQRDTSNQAFWGGKAPIWDGEGGRKRNRKKETERYVKSSFSGWKDTNLGQGRREREKEKERYVKSSFLGWKDTNLGWRGREKERERHREIRQIKLFGVERQQFGTERKGERDWLLHGWLTRHTSIIQPSHCLS